MRTWIAAAVVLFALVVVPAAEAKTPIDRWAARNHLSGSWRAKDKDRDGIKNRREFALKTNPRKADSDRARLHDGDVLTIGTDPRKRDSDGDGVRDGDENAGVITAYDGTTVTVRRFHGGVLRAQVEEDSLCAGSDVVEEETDAEPVPEDDGYIEVTEDAASGDPHWAEPDESEVVEDEAPVEGDEEVVDLGGDDDYGYAGCDDPRLKPGALVTSAVVKSGVATEINVKAT